MIRKVLGKYIAAVLCASVILNSFGMETAAAVPSSYADYVKTDGNYASHLTGIYKEGYNQVKELANGELWDCGTKYIPGAYAYAFDHPATFVDYNKGISADKGAKTLSKAASIAASVSGSTRFEIALGLYDKVMAAVSYDRNGVNGAQSAYEALVLGKAACTGYAASYKLLCDLRDIPCYMVTGTASNAGGSERHAWNIIQLDDGEWYEVDATWDDSLGRHDFFGLTTKQMKSYKVANQHTTHIRDTVATADVSGSDMVTFKKELEVIYGTIPTANGTQYRYGNVFVEKDGLTYYITSKSKKTARLIGISDKKKNKKAEIKLETVTFKGKKYKITEIGKGALKGAKAKSVTLGANLKSIGDEAFSECRNLKTIKIKSKKLTYVGENAFYGTPEKAKYNFPGGKKKKYRELFIAAGASENAKFK
ncbi:leucine-rich repeat domain-containing protein [Butyrivibrio sp. AD3002]|uniref:leucine-rich repeat domain-containing protein n=1 Tax=Butyrivibrio sp. AD3002 TaxID=1280670 RepID=UPI0003B360DD|nr:leucine-rich repeat domain-containing protein [Butyrivibrio sp. AD3002]